jgi:hypothetical protein
MSSKKSSPTSSCFRRLLLIHALQFCSHGPPSLRLGGADSVGFKRNWPRSHRSPPATVLLRQKGTTCLNGFQRSSGPLLRPTLEAFSSSTSTLLPTTLSSHQRYRGPTLVGPNRIRSRSGRRFITATCPRVEAFAWTSSKTIGVPRSRSRKFCCPFARS